MWGNEMRAEFIRGLMALTLAASCAAGTTGPASTGGAGGGGTGGGGSGGSGGSSILPAFATSNAAGKIAGRTYNFVTGFVRPVPSDATAMEVELLGFSPELASTPCWSKPPAGTPSNTDLRILFRAPRTGGSFEWGGGRSVAGWSTVSLVSLEASGTPTTSTSDKAKMVIGAMPAQVNGEVNGSFLVQADTSNTVNGTFSVRRCDP
jgi:hypothetical protein